MHYFSHIRTKNRDMSPECREKAGHISLHLATLFLFTCTLLLSGCSSDKASREFFAMDTVMRISASGGNAEQALEDAEAEINRLDRLFSISVSDSDIARLNRSGRGAVSAETGQLLERSAEFSSRTDGSFDITVYPLEKLWGFYDGNQKVPSKAALSSALQSVGMEHAILTGNPSSGCRNTAGSGRHRQRVRLVPGSRADTGRQAFLRRISPWGGMSMLSGRSLTVPTGRSPLPTQTTPTAMPEF